MRTLWHVVRIFQQVLLEVVVSRKCHSTIWTIVRLYASVSTSMNDERTMMSKFHVAIVTLITFLIAVKFCMLFECTGKSEFFLTNITAVRFFSGVCPPVTLKSRWISKSTNTIGARIRFLLCVNMSDVSMHVSVLSKSLLAEHAFIRQFACMISFVYCKTCWLSKSFPTVTANVRLFFRMQSHMTC